MDSSFSYWEKQSFFNYDVIIAGSGIVGLSAAIHLKEKRPELRLAVLERGFLPAGASTKNAGFACFGSISELIEQEKICGTDNLHQLIENRWKGLLKLRKLLGDDNLDYKNFGGYEIFKTSESALAEKCVSKIEHFNQLIRDITGDVETFQVADAKTGSFGFEKVSCLIENKFESQINTGKMMSALLHKAISSGIFIFNSCNITQISEEENQVSVLSPEGSFRCEKLLLATNAFTGQLLPDLDIIPGRGQVLITAPIKNLKVKGTFNYDKGYYYFRNIDNRLLLGGGRNLDFDTEQTTQFGLTDIVQLHLENLLREVILPKIDFTIEERWSGIMAFGSQIQPIIKQVKNNVFCAVRCNGMGVAMGTQTGENAAEMIIKNLFHS